MIPIDLVEEWQALPAQFEAALADDLNTALALGYIFANARIVNRLLEDRKLRASRQTGVILEEFLARADVWKERLGLFGAEPRQFLVDLRSMRAQRANLDIDKVSELLERRVQARSAKDFLLSDKLRDELAAMGVEVRDTPMGQIWDMAGA